MRKNSFQYPILSQWLDQVGASNVLYIGSGQSDCFGKVEFGGRKYTGVEPSSFLRERAVKNFPQLRDQVLDGNTC